MECKFAYTQPNIPYVLCKKENVPTGYDRKELFHAVCIHQVHCPKQNCHRLTAEWKTCMKLAEKPQNGAGVAFVAEASVGGATKKTPQKRTRKPKTEE